MGRQAYCWLAKSGSCSRMLEPPWQNCGTHPGPRAIQERMYLLVALSISRVKRSVCINEENLKLISLCSMTALRLIKIITNHTGTFTPQLSQWIKCMNTHDEQLFHISSETFSKAWNHKNLTLVQKLSKKPWKQDQNFLFILCKKVQHGLAERTLA